MEEKTKQQFPIKTKIAIWWMIIIGLFGMIGLTDCFSFTDYSTTARGVLKGVGKLIVIPISFFLICCGVLFSIVRKRWVWFIVIIILFFESIIVTIPFLFLLVPSVESLIINDVLLYSFLVFLMPVVPFILLLLDRKNFWKIAT